MVDFGSRYLPPGVYIEESVTPLVSVIGVQPTVVAIVGPSVGYRTHTEAVTLSSTTPVALAKLGIDQDTVVVAAADGTAYVDTTYDLAASPGEDDDVDITEDNPTTIARQGAGIPDGSTVYVSYQYTDTDYRSPQRVQDFDEVKDIFGEPFDLATGTITSPLSLAAKVALENGASQLVLVATEGSASSLTRTELSDGYVKLSGLTDVNVVVGLPVGITGTPSAPGDTVNVGGDLMQHCEDASDDSLFRIGIIGYEKTSTATPDVLAAGYRSPRMILAWPNRLNYFNGFTNTTLEVSGYYLAAAYAGRIAGLPVQMPLTKKQIRGFSGLPASVVQTMTSALKNSWSDSGVAVAELTRDGRLVVRHGTTTQRDTVNHREISLVRAKDSLVTLIQDTTDRADLIGTPIDEDTPIRVKGVIMGCLETAVSSSIIVAYNNLKVRQRSVDPSVIEVKFQYQPAYPLNYIVVSFSINVTTGETDVIETAA